MLRRLPRATRPDTLCPYRTLFRSDSNMKIRVIVDWIDNVEVVGPYQVRIHAKAPTPAAFEYLTGTSPIFPDGHYESAPSVTGADGKPRRDWGAVVPMCRSEEHTSELQSLMRHSYAGFRLKTK